MNRRFFYAVCVLTLCARPSVSSSSTLDRVVSRGQPIVLKLSDLRSAYLLRDGLVSYGADAGSPGGVRRQLRQHFDVVLGLLIIATPHSIETALDRLEMDRHESWSHSERNRWRQQLFQNRYAQMMRLAAYRDRGLFPQNEGQSAAPAPIFVDRYDTACAVGHLMRLGGWDTAVQGIEQGNNLVYVPDAAHSALASWVRTSGLTLEEAALIQPAYPYPIDSLIRDFGPGEPALVRDGLRFENFYMEAQNFIPTPLPFHTAVEICEAGPGTCGAFFQPTDGLLPNPENVGFGAAKGFVFGFLTPDIDPVGTHWIVIGGAKFALQQGFPTPISNHLLEAEALLGRVQRILVRFDVSPVSPDAYINQFTQQVPNEFYGGISSLNLDVAQFEIETRVRNGQTDIASAYVDELSFPREQFGHSIQTANFERERELTVETTIWLYNGVEISSYLIDFNVVPEPACAMLLVMGMAIVSVLQRGKRRDGANDDV